MRRAAKILILSAAAALVLSPVQARAEGYISPWVATNAGTGFNGSNLGNSFNNGRVGVGTQVGAMGKGIIGAELDLGWSPSFFGTTNDFGNNSVMNVMGNLIVGVPVGGTRGGGVRPYVTAGLGLLRTQIDGGTIATVSSSNNDLGWNAGGGVMGFFSDHFGVRGDVRYLRNIQNNSTSVTDINFDPGNFHFWRASIGVVLR
jgi:outer membrane protein with beta-barrel domain